MKIYLRVPNTGGDKPRRYFLGRSSSVGAAVYPRPQVGRATVPADIGRHGGQPNDTTRPKFLFRIDWTLAGSGDAHIKEYPSSLTTLLSVLTVYFYLYCDGCQNKV
jgi:hypothetical protein